MTAATQVVSEAKGYFFSSFRDEVNVLATSLSDTTGTSVVLTYASNGMGMGSLLSTGLEAMFVVAWNSGTKTATVIRGWDGSTAATHASGVVVWVNPKVADYQWLRFLNGELKSLSSPLSGLFRVSPVELTFNSSRVGYDLTGISSVDDLTSVLAEQPGAERNWVPLSRNQWDLQRNQDSGDFASGFSLRILNGAVESGRTIRVVLKQQFTSLAALTDDVETVAGLPATCLDIAAIGMAIRAVAGREIARNFTDAQGDTRRAGEVPAGAVNQSAGGLRQLYRDRKQEEAARLVRQYGL